jgi:hypothetical protein
LAAQHCAKCGTKLKPDARFCPNCGAAVRGGRSSGQRAAARGPRWPLIAIVGGGVLLIAIALVLALGGGRGAQTQVASSPTEEPGASNIPYPSVERISPEETHAMVQNGEAIIVDVRDQAAFEAGHAAGALSLPEAELADRLSELPRQQMIITYCT